MASSYSAYIPPSAPASSDSSYEGYTPATSAEVRRVLNAECSEASLSTCQIKQSEPRIARGMAGLEGRKDSDDERLQRIVDSVQPLPLRPEVRWEKDDPKHRVAELLVACWGVYKQQGGVDPARSPGFFAWLDGIPELKRIMMISDAIKFYGTGVLGSPEERARWPKNAPIPGDPRRPKPPGQIWTDFRLIEGVKEIKQSVHTGKEYKEKIIIPEADTRPNLKPSVVKAFLKGVAYLDQLTRPSYKVSFTGGLAMYRGKPLDTGQMQTVFSGRGFAIWVIDPSGEMYAANHVYGQIHHSSFLAGGEIKAGGEILATNGRVDFLSGKSGHYHPPMLNLVWALQILQFRLVDISRLRVLVFEPATQKPVVVKAQTLIENPNRYGSWGNLSDQDKKNIRAQFELL